MIKLFLITNLLILTPAVFGATSGCGDTETCLPGSSGSSDNVDGQACFAVTNRIDGSAAVDRDQMKVSKSDDGIDKSDKSTSEK